MTDTPEGLGRQLCAAFAETFEGGPWLDAPQWEDFDEAQQARWDRTAALFTVQALSTAQQDRERMRGAVLKAKELMRQIAGRTLENRTEALADEAFSILRQALKEKVDE